MLRHGLRQTEAAYNLQALLSNAFAWMRKASDDQLDGMVALLQKLLQLYAARALSGGRGSNAAAAGEASEASSAEAVLERIVASDEEQWDNLLKQPEVQQVSMACFAGTKKPLERAYRDIFITKLLNDYSHPASKHFHKAKQAQYAAQGSHVNQKSILSSYPLLVCVPH